MAPLSFLEKREVVFEFSLLHVDVASLAQRAMLMTRLSTGSIESQIRFYQGRPPQPLQ